MWEGLDLENAKWRGIAVEEERRKEWMGVNERRNPPHLSKISR